MQFTLFLVIAAFMMVGFTQQPIAMLDFTHIAPCTAKCLVLKADQQHCSPPLVDIHDAKGHRACFCAFPTLQSLHRGPGLCFEYCNKTEEYNIYEAFKNTCTKQSLSPPLPSSSSVSQFAPTSLSSTTSSSSLSLITASATTSVAFLPTAPVPSTLPKDHSNWKYLVAAGVLLVAILAILFTFAFFHHRHENAKPEDPTEGNGAIPLRSFSLSGNDSRLGTSSSEIGQEPTTPASPLASATSPHSFGERLRAMTREEEERRMVCGKKGDRLRAFLEVAKGV